MTFKFEDPRATPSEEPSGLREVARISEAAAPGASGSHAAPHDHPARKRALLVGSPNVGKSVLFGALTGRYVTVSNYPGTTVEITRGKISFEKREGSDDEAEPWELLDSPGTNNLVAMSEDEAVTRDILLTERQDALVQVGDAKNLARTLLMTFQLAELGVPFLLNLNMMDEAAARGLHLDFDALRKELTGIEVNSSAAIRGEGIEPIRHYLVRAAGATGATGAAYASDTDPPISDETPKGGARAPLPCIPTFPEDVEAAIARVEAQLVDAGTALEVAPRAVATLLLSGDRGLGGALETMVSPAVRAAARLEAEALSAAHSMPVFALLNKLRLGRAQAIVRAVQTKTGGKSRSATEGATPVTWSTSLFTAAIGSAIAAWWFAGFTWPSAVLFAIAFPLSAVVVRRHVQARVAAWKLAFAFAAGYFVWFFVSLVPPLAAAIAPVIGALIGLAALAYFARVGDHQDSDNARRFGRLAVHPVWGVPILLVVLFFAYKIVGEFGAGTAVDFLENGAFGSVSARTELTAPVAADIAAGDTAAEGAERLLVVPAGTPAAHVAPDGTSVLAQVKTGGAYVAETRARVDFYPAKKGGPAEARIWSGFANRAAFSFFTWLGIPLLTAFFVGTYGMLTMGVTYAVAIVLPVVATFFFVFSVLEDSGYLPRLAVMANRQLRVIGLNGKAVLPMVLGLGCDTMATLTARILETKKERVLVTLLLALGIPCSSQLSVVFALMQRTSPIASVAWVASVLLTIGIVGWVSAKVIPGDKSDFLLEMPPIRRPQIGNLATKTFARIEWYLREAVPLFLAGTALLFVLDKFDLLVYVHRAGEPIVHGVLGFTRDRLVSDKVSEALLIGFLRRDFGAAGLLDLARGGQLSTADIAVSMVTITLFIPCIANVFMIVKERGWKVGTAMCGVHLPLRGARRLDGPRRLLARWTFHGLLLRTKGRYGSHDRMLDVRSRLHQGGGRGVRARLPDGQGLRPGHLSVVRVRVPAGVEAGEPGDQPVQEEAHRGRDVTCPPPSTASRQAVHAGGREAGRPRAGPPRRGDAVAHRQAGGAGAPARSRAAGASAQAGHRGRGGRDGPRARARSGGRNRRRSGYEDRMRVELLIAAAAVALLAACMPPGPAVAAGVRARRRRPPLALRAVPPARRARDSAPAPSSTSPWRAIATACTCPRTTGT